MFNGSMNLVLVVFHSTESIDMWGQEEYRVLSQCSVQSFESNQVAELYTIIVCQVSCDHRAINCILLIV